MTSPGTKPHIAFMITRSEVGGAQRWVRDQMALLDQDAECHLVCGDEGWLTTETPANKRHVETALLRRLPSIAGLFRLRHHLKARKIRTVIASSANAGLYARLLKIIMPALRVVYVSHGWSSVYNGGRLAPLYTFIERWLASLTDKILCVSDADHRIAVERIGIPEARCITIRNAVFAPEKVDPPPAGPPWRLLCVGRLAHPKRPDLLIEALEWLPNLDVKLTVIGDGPDRNMIESTKEQRVEWLGEIPGFDRYANWHLFCLVSESEGLPMSALEARAAGCPMLLSDVGGCPELIDGNGRITNNTPEDIAAGIREILENYPAYQTRAMTLARDNNLARNRDHYLAVYRGDGNGEDT